MYTFKKAYGKVCGNERKVGVNMCERQTDCAKLWEIKISGTAGLKIVAISEGKVIIFSKTCTQMGFSLGPNNVINSHI